MREDESVREEVTTAVPPEKLVEQVRERYARIAETGSGCCGETTTLKPQDVSIGLGCGIPIPALELQPGETVLDLGSGAGLDAFFAVKQVGPNGRASAST